MLSQGLLWRMIHTDEARLLISTSSTTSHGRKDYSLLLTNASYKTEPAHLLKSSVHSLRHLIQVKQMIKDDFLISHWFFQFYIVSFIVLCCRMALCISHLTNDPRGTKLPLSLKSSATLFTGLFATPWKHLSQLNNNFSMLVCVHTPFLLRLLQHYWYVLCSVYCFYLVLADFTRIVHFVCQCLLGSSSICGSVSS